MKATQLHEILAVEAGLKKTSRDMIDEGANTFAKRSEHFAGSVRTYDCKVEGDVSIADEQIVERQDIVTTVNDKLEYVLGHVVRHIDSMATKDNANQIAVADIEVGGKVLAEEVPVTTLLSLEDEIKRIREMVKAIPTLAPGKSWIKAEELGPNIFKLEHPELKTRTRKTLRNHVKAEATEKHPAQVELFQEDIPVGVYTTERTSGAITPAAKAEMLDRVDQTFRAVKQARQRANATEITQVEMARPLADFILKG